VININEVAANAGSVEVKVVKVQVEGLRLFRFRLWWFMQLMRLASWVCPFTIDFAGLDA
jgi:hypothetical protein